jgi:hypothetical protein
LAVFTPFPRIFRAFLLHTHSFSGRFLVFFPIFSGAAVSVHFYVGYFSPETPLDRGVSGFSKKKI